MHNSAIHAKQQQQQQQAQQQPQQQQEQPMIDFGQGMRMTDPPMYPKPEGYEQILPQPLPPMDNYSYMQVQMGHHRIIT